MLTRTRNAINLTQKRAFVCDLDGTLFMGKRTIAPAVRFVIEHAQDDAFYYLTNNTSKTPDAYLQKLDGAEIVTMAGDRLYDDKTVADNAAVDFICVLSRETTRESLSGYRGQPPAAVVETLGDLA